MRLLLTVSHPGDGLAFQYPIPYDPDTDERGAWDLNQPHLSGDDRERALKLAHDAGWVIADSAWSLRDHRWEITIARRAGVRP
jgi:hypothetical protein